MRIASNEVFRRLDKTFTDPRLCRIVDRLTFGGNIIETGTDPYQVPYARRRCSARLVVAASPVR